MPREFVFQKKQSPEPASLQPYGRGWEYVGPFSPIEPGLPDMPQRPRQVPVDDGRVGGRFRNPFRRGSTSQASSIEPRPIVRAHPQSPTSGINPRVTRELVFPTEQKQNLEQFEQLLSSLSCLSSPISLEIVGTASAITYQLSTAVDDAELAKSHIEALLTGIRLFGQEDALKRAFPAHKVNDSIVADFGLARDWFVPIRNPKSNSTNPLTPLFAVMDGLAANEAVCIQVRFSRTRNNWTSIGRGAVFDSAGKFTYPESNENTCGIREKLNGPILAATFRLAVASSNRTRSVDLARITQVYFLQFASGYANRLIPLRNEHGSEAEQLECLINRTSLRSGFLITPKELAAIVRFPSDETSSAKLRMMENTTRQMPELAARGDLLIGVNEHEGNIRHVRISETNRIKHTHLVGASGSGKSTLLTTMMSHDLTAGNGFGVLDPHGDLVDSIIERIPSSRLRDVILFDPSDQEYPIGFNPLATHSDLEKVLVASDLTGIFRRFSTSWGDQMDSVLSNAVLAFLYSDRGGSLVDMRRFLIDKAFRNEFLETVSDEEIKFYWQWEFPELRGRPYAPLLTRLDKFLRSKLIRNIVAQRENKLDFRSIMDRRKILLVKLSLGAIGEESAYLLGSLLVAKLYLAALSRQDIAEESRNPFHLYLDEAHHFITPSMNQILSGVRKYKIGLVLGHQNLAQFHNADADILASALANCYTRICFRVDDQDAERLARGFTFFTAEHLKNLGVGQAIARFEQSQFSFNLRTFPMGNVSADVAAANKHACVEQTRRLYARPIAEIEAEIDEHRNSHGVRSLTINYPVKKCQKLEIAEVPAEKNVGRIPNPGRGGRHHQEIQQMIATMAEKLGFVFEIEKPILGGIEKVDVSVEGHGMSLACEVSVSTTDYEMHNAEKCLAAGYDRVFIVVANRRKLPLIKKKLRADIPLEFESRVDACSLMDLLALLQKQSGKELTPTTKNHGAERVGLAEACQLLNKSPSTIYRWINEGRLPFYRVGREYQFDRRELLLIGKSGGVTKSRPRVDVEAIKLEKTTPKRKKGPDARYRKMLELD